MEIARSLISKLVEEKLQRERKTSKILKKSRGKSDNRSIETVEQMPQNKVVETYPVISVTKINAIVLSFPTKKTVIVKLDQHTYTHYQTKSSYVLFRRDTEWLKVKVRKRYSRQTLT